MRARRLRLSLEGLQLRLLLLPLLATAPLLALLVTGMSIDRQQVLASARQRVVELARLGAEQQDDITNEAQILLRTLSQIPDMQGMVASTCHEILRLVVGDRSHFSAILVARRDGSLVCTSDSGQPAITIRHRAYFQQLMQPDGPMFTLSELLRGQQTGRPTVVAAVPLTAGASAERNGVIAAALNLDWFSQLARHLQNAAGYTVLVIDPRDGAVLAQSGGAQNWVSNRFFTHPLVETLRAMPGGGMVETIGFDGVEEVFGIAPLPGLQPSIAIAVGLPRAVVLAEANHRLWLGGSLALCVTAFAILASLLTANVSLLRPMQALMAAVGRLGAGDLTARAAYSRAGVREVRALAVTFNRMASRLRARERELAVVQSELVQSEEHHRLLATNSTDMISRLDPAFHRTYMSPSCREILGYTPEELVGRTAKEIVHPDDWPDLDATLNATMRAGQPARGVFRALRKDGSYVWLEANGRPLPGSDGYVVVTRDVSERIAFERKLAEVNQQLEDLAMQDALTGLANRRRFDDMLAKEYRRALRLGIPMAVIMADVDRFKSYNDTYGHPAGDECLHAIGQGIDSALRRPGDLAARYGGEEFAVLLPGTDEAGAEVMAGRISSAIRQIGILHAGSETGSVTLSLGVAAAIPPVEPGGPAALLAAADRALYVAKMAGRNEIRLASGLPGSVSG